MWKVWTGHVPRSRVLFVHFESRDFRRGTWLPTPPQTMTGLQLVTTETISFLATFISSPAESHLLKWLKRECHQQKKKKIFFLQDSPPAVRPSCTLKIIFLQQLRHNLIAICRLRLASRANAFLISHLLVTAVWGDADGPSRLEVCSKICPTSLVFVFLCSDACYRNTPPRSFLSVEPSHFLRVNQFTFLFCSSELPVSMTT